MILIDAGYLTARSRYAFKALKNSKGAPTGAVFGFLSTLQQIIRNYPNEEVIVCLEGFAAWRSIYIPGYKQHREARQPEYFGSDAQCQHQLEKDAITALSACLPGVKVVRGDEAEADDLIAIYCQSNEGCTIFSSDKDMWQLAQFGAKMTNKLERGKFVFLPLSVEFEEVPVGNLALYRAIKGDSSDAIPGVFRASTKVAKAIASRYSSPSQLTPEVVTALVAEFGKAAEIILLGLDQIKTNFVVCRLPPDRQVAISQVAPDVQLARYYINLLELETLRYIVE